MTDGMKIGLGYESTKIMIFIIFRWWFSNSSPRPDTKSELFFWSVTIFILERATECFLCVCWVMNVRGYTGFFRDEREELVWRKMSKGTDIHTPVTANIQNYFTSLQASVWGGTAWSEVLYHITVSLFWILFSSGFHTTHISLLYMRVDTTTVLILLSSLVS